ncbi:MAG: hypothetical protein QG635_540 [Bacteroidota bacterium]|nr:hypothetical protein [Bacteroidota bacterium]
MEWYIAKAGGYAPSAEKGRARIIRGRNKVWIEGNDEVLVYAGDQIYVPRPPDVPKSLEIQNYGVVASMIASVAVMISVLYNILKY